MFCCCGNNLATHVTHPSEVSAEHFHKDIKAELT